MDGLMPVTKDSGGLPTPGGMMPNDQEFGLAEAFPGFNLTEGMMAFFDGAIILDREHPQASLRKDAPKVTTNILASFIDIVLPGPGDATLVVVELKVWVQVACVLFELVGRAAVVESIKQCSVHI
ncbi:hypothetical protein GCM10007898_35480 [Dyella flagellata]|uniref:Uncharacterized protein n=1 Tax=Dyella flagellata TaxID=1867833 RepID=A0ABQ5XEA5_9GAMM|nr:hypothetical protein GCM10007898_35480 [Dyella flagellata]